MRELAAGRINDGSLRPAVREKATLRFAFGPAEKELLITTLTLLLRWARSAWARNWTQPADASWISLTRLPSGLTAKRWISAARTFMSYQRLAFMRARSKRITLSRLLEVFGLKERS